MKKSFILLALTLAFDSLLVFAPSYALSTPQVDFLQGYDDFAEEIIIAYDSSFQLVSFLTPGYSSSLLSYTSYIPVARRSKLTALTPVGSDFLGNQSDEPSRMTYGALLFETGGYAQLFPPAKVSKHSLFKAGLNQFEVNTGDLYQGARYGSADDPGEQIASGSGAGYAIFERNDSKLSSPFYTFQADGPAQKKGFVSETHDFHPFFLDAKSGRPLPEPANMLLFGTGMIGLAAVARRKTKKSHYNEARFSELLPNTFFFPKEENKAWAISPPSQQSSRSGEEPRLTAGLNRGLS